MFKHNKADNKVDDALDHIRAAAQELHGAISDAAAKRGGAVKADLEAASSKAKALTESVKDAIERTERGHKEAPCGGRHASRSDAEARRRGSEEFRPGIPDLGQAIHKAGSAELLRAFGAPCLQKPSA